MSHLVDKIKHVVHPTGNKTPDEIDNDKHRAMNDHEAEEQRADALAKERELDEVAHPAQHGTPTSLPPQQQHDLSSFPHRDTLADAAHHEHHSQTHPDLAGVTHIPESELPERHYRKENTALRPADPNDPRSMDGAANYNVAGDDRTL
ncbi:uncharacterized protein JCM6883_001747 [Sporobolomyces salmoneus]|uniref:uncharacterized protein n=1 Tax=Sporobolomyces salmoneus TaxID=183962 RepID=UPI0031716F8F